jgi:flavodoxin
MKPKFLIAYFSHQGHTRKVAEYIASVTGGDLFEIIPEKKYLPGYACLPRVAKEVKQDLRPEIRDRVDGFDQYTDIVIGYPAWDYTCPKIIQTFVELYDFSGKEVYPFDTHGGSGALGTDKIRESCNGTVHECKDGNHLTEEQIKQWLLM